ncbi:MAG: hypothetical protein ACREOF_06770 [Gemmatimonadales bacterium]
MLTHTADAVSRARGQAQQILQQVPSFGKMSLVDQLSLYRTLVKDELAKGAAPPRRNGSLARGLEDAPPPPTMGGLTKADVTNTRLDTLAQQGADFINEIDFPQFVSDLLEGVFKSNIKVMMKQTEMYQKLLKTAMDSLAKYVNKIDDAAAFAYLVDKSPEQFSLGVDEEEKDAEGKPQTVLTNKQGEKLDLGDNELKARVMDAKIAMAKEHRAMIRETILMGITRLVVEKGVVEASVLFDVNATEKIDRQGKSGNQWEKTTATESGGSGVLGWLTGGGDETTTETRHAQITVSSVKAVADSRLAAQIKGNVKIQFISDYFKLENFAKLYEGGGDGGAALGQIPGSPALLGMLPNRGAGAGGAGGAAGAGAAGAGG